MHLHSLLNRTLVIAALAALPAAAAALGLEFDTPIYLAESRCKGLCLERGTTNNYVLENRTERDGLAVPPGISASFKTLIEMHPDFRFPFSTSLVPGAFISASIDTEGNADVGVSGFTHPGANWEAETVFSQKVTNRGQDAELVNNSFTISAGEVSLYTARSNSQNSANARAFASARLELVERDEFGVVVKSEAPFYHVALVSKEQQGLGLAGVQVDFDFPDIANARTFERYVTTGAGTRPAAGGLRWDDFTNSFSYALASGHSLNYTYTLLTLGVGDFDDAPFVLDDRSIAYQALIGDPFDITGAGSGGIVIESGGLVPVPEPASAWLWGAGLLALLHLARRSRASRDAPDALGRLATGAQHG
jgi:hypothetical protein